MQFAKLDSLLPRARPLASYVSHTEGLVAIYTSDIDWTLAEIEFIHNGLCVFVHINFCSEGKLFSNCTGKHTRGARELDKLDTST